MDDRKILLMSKIVIELLLDLYKEENTVAFPEILAHIETILGKVRGKVLDEIAITYIATTEFDNE